MRKSKLQFPFLMLFGFVLFNSACAQNPPMAGQSYLYEQKLAEQSTILLNNGNYIIPLQNLDQQKIASVHFSNAYAAGFDSLLNKYSKVATFNGADYTGVKSLDHLSYDLKWYNTVIVQLTEADLANQQILTFISSVQKNRNVIIALFGGAGA